MLHYIQNAPVKELLLASLLVVTTFSSSGLVAIGAGLSRMHWFWGMLLVIAVSTIPLAISADELIVLLLVQGLSTVAILRLIVRRRRPAVGLSRTQWGLRDLLLMMVLVALVLALLTRVSRETWEAGPAPVFWSLGLTVLTLLGAWCGLECSRGWLRALVACLVLPVALVALCLQLVRPDQRRGWPVKRAAGAVLALLIVLPPLFVLYRLLTPPPIPRVELHARNGYPDLLEAAAALRGVKIPNQDDSWESFQAFTTQYRETLEKTHAALKLPCYTPLRYDLADSYGPSPDLSPLLHALYVDAALARHEGRNTQALRDYLGIIRWGKALAHGRLVDDAMASQFVTERNAIAKIAELRNSLSPHECQEAIAQLQQIETDREPWEAILTRQRAWNERTRSWFSRVFDDNGIVPRLAGTLWISMKYDLRANRELKAHKQCFLGELALCGYVREHGTLPEALDELVPQFFSTLPEDPFSGQPLVYRRTATGYLLYSVGPDGKDDGGKPHSPGSLPALGDILWQDPPAPAESEAEEAKPAE